MTGTTKRLRCAYSGSSLRDLVNSAVRLDRPAHDTVICPGCRRELKVTHAGFTGQLGAIPQHKRPA